MLLVHEDEEEVGEKEIFELEPTSVTKVTEINQMVKVSLKSVARWIALKL